MNKTINNIYIFNAQLFIREGLKAYTYCSNRDCGPLDCCVLSNPFLNLSKADLKRGYTRLKGYIEERAIELAGFIIEKKTTVRAAAKKFGISKSTVHKDVTERLIKISPELADKVRLVLEENKAERHIRGGRATKAKYQGKA